jgi:autotransporter translocation and assembly factor TamB
VGLLVVLAFSTLSDRAVTTTLARQAIIKLQKQIPADIYFDHAWLDVLHGRAYIDGIKLTLPGHPKEKFLTARQVIIDIHVLSLLHGQFNIIRLQLINPEATIIHRGHDHYNVVEIIPVQDKLAKPNKSASVMEIRTLVITGGHITYLDPPRNITAEMPHFEGLLKLDLPGQRINGQVTFATGWAKFQGQKQPIESFLGAFHWDNKTVRIDKLKMASSSTDLAMSGLVGGLGDDKQPINLQGLLKTRLQQWAKLANQPVSGSLTADFQLAGTAQAPQVAGRVSGQGLGYKAVRVETLNARLTSTDAAIKVEELTAKIWGGIIAGRATIPLKKGARLVAAVHADKLDLAAALSQLEVKGVKGVRGFISANFNATGDRPAPEAVLANGWVLANGHVPVNGRDLPLTARTDFRWDAGRLDVTGLDARALGAHIHGRGQVTPLAKVPLYSLLAHVDTLAVAEVERLTGQVLPVTGIVAGDIRINGRDFKKPKVVGDARLVASGALKAKQAGNIVALPFAGTATVGILGDALRIADSHFQILGGQVAARGTVGLGGKKPLVKLLIDGRGVDLGAVDRTFAIAKGQLAGRVDAYVMLDDQVLNIRSLEARALGGRIGARGRVLLASKPAAYALQVDAHALDLGVATRTFHLTHVPVSGKAEAALVVSGAGPRFHAVGPVSLQGAARVPDGLGHGRTTPLPFRIAGLIEAGARTLRLAPLTAKVGASTLDANGALNLDGVSNLVVHGRVVDTPAIAAIFGVKDVTGGLLTLDGRAAGTPGNIQLTGHLSAAQTRVASTLRFSKADVTFQGAFANRLHITGAINGQDLVLAGQPVSTISTPWVYDAEGTKPGTGTLSISKLDAKLASGHVLGKASYDLDHGDYNADVRTLGLTLGDLEALKARGDTGVPPTTAFVVAFNGRGTLNNPQGDLKLELQPFNYKGQTFGATAVKGHLASGALALDGGLLGKELVLTGRLPLVEGANGELLLHFNDVRLAPLFALAPASVSEQVELPIDGQLAGQVLLAGPVSHPEKMTAKVDLSRLRLGFRDLLIENEGPVKLTYAGRQINIETLHVKGQGTDLNAQGIIGLSSPSDFTASGKLNLALLEKISPKNFADASGSASIDASLKGTMGQPDVTGALSIRNGELLTRNLPQTIRDLNASVRLDRDRVFLDRLNATLGYTGKIEAFGGATLAPDMSPSSVNLQLTGRELAIRIPDTSALVDADIAFSGTPDSSRLDGQVKVLEAKYTKDIPLTGSIGGRRGASSAVNFAQIPFLRNLDLQLQVVAPGQVVVKNNLANLELRSDLMILGTPADPAIVGRAEAMPGGKITFQDRTYDVGEATVDFIDSHRIKPYIHLVASTIIQSIAVNLSANGTPDALRLDLKSTPYLPQQDVLTLIATGQTPAQLADSGGSGGAALSNLLVNQISKGVERGVSDQGAIDVLRIQPGTTTAGETSGGSLTVGKRINDKLMISYTQDLTTPTGQKPGHQVIFDYTLTDFMVLKLQQDISGGFNASARYRYPVR